jgi:TolA-binding protein|tara:strand:- start:11017 stop:11811 length:795 start_codon:yes stop_codon:yes gene_type:complete
MKLRLIAISLIILSTGCALTTPLVVAGAGGHAIARHEEDIRVRGAAALQEEPDLLTYSVEAIARNKEAEAVATYSKGLTSDDYSHNIKSLALYQIGLLYMNPYSEARNDDKALSYFNQHLEQYPKSKLRPKIKAKIALIKKRKSESNQLSAKEMLKLADRMALLAQPSVPFDAELTPMSERAISNDRIEDAESVYLIIYNNKASSDQMRAKALYQLGLIYMSEYNTHHSTSKAIKYFRMIKEEFPETRVAKKANKRISQVINQQ